MSRAPTALDPWRLVWGQPYIDSRTLAAAIEQDLAQGDQSDFRTRLLVRDAAVARPIVLGLTAVCAMAGGQPGGPANS